MAGVERRAPERIHRAAAMSAYVLAKQVHVICVALSIAGFVARFALSLARPEVLRHRFVRIAPHVNDTILLAAAVAMLVLARWNVLETPWLLAKIAGLVAYIGLGMVALRFGRSMRVRAAAFAGAVLVFGYVVSVALTKNAAGVLAALFA